MRKSADTHCSSKKVFVNNNGVNIYVKIKGKHDRTPPIIMIHGFADTHKVFGCEQDILCKHYQTFAPDLRGHGKSDKPQGLVYSLQDYASDINAIVNQFGIFNPVLFGWSLGGMIVMQYLQTYGVNSVSKVVLVDSVPNVSFVSNPETFAILQVLFDGDFVGFVEQWIPFYFSNQERMCNPHDLNKLIRRLEKAALTNDPNALINTIIQQSGVDF